MYHGKRVAVIIAAGGQGKRFGAAMPKQYLKIGGQPVIIKAMKVFDRMEAVDHILNMFAHTKNNEEFVQAVKKTRFF